MADDNKVIKYTRYAIGEIVLVVIGILIALSINNWNQNRKELLEEKSLFAKIINDLNIDSINIKSTIIDLKKRQDLHYQIYKETMGEAQFDSTFVYGYLRWASHYDLLMFVNHSSAAANISNDVIRYQLNDYFSVQQRTNIAVNTFDETIRGVTRSYLSKYGINNTDAVYKEPPYEHLMVFNVDHIIYDNLKLQYGTKEFDQLLFTLRVSTAYPINNLENLLIANSNLKHALKKELKN